MNNNYFTKQGWQCPICGYVWSPSHPSCNNCNRPENEKYTFKTTIPNIKGEQEKPINMEVNKNE